MTLNENMPNFNHRNPYVIVCSQTRSRLDDKMLHMTKQWLITTMMNAVSAAVCVAIALYVTFGMQIENMLYSISGIIGVGFMVFNLVYFFVISWKMSKLTDDPIRRKVDNLMQSQLSEVANMNNEEVNQAIIDMNFILGKVSIFFHMLNIGKWFTILTTVYFFLILLGCTFLT